MSTLKDSMSNKKQDSLNRFPNLLDLSSDLSHLLRGAIMWDFSLYVNNKSIVHCHKDILRYRSRWFFDQIKESNGTKVKQLVILEDMQILEAVLIYIYSGNLRMLESLEISLLDLYQASVRYGLISLEISLSKMVKEQNVKQITRVNNFLWKIKIDDNYTPVATSSIIDNFTIRFVDTWKIEIKPLNQSNEGEPTHGVYLTLQSEGSRGTSYTVSLSIYVVDVNGDSRCFFPTVQKTFLEDHEYFLFGFLKRSEIAKEAATILRDGVLHLTCELTGCAKIGYFKKFRIDEPYIRCISNELVELSEGIFKLFRYACDHDRKLKISSSCTLTFHSYILFIRTRIPQACTLEALQVLVNMGSIGWTSFISFLYSGQARYLDHHGRNILLALSKTSFAEAKQKYSFHLSRNLTTENAFNILCDAVEYKDEYLISRAADFLAKQSKYITSYEVWIRIARDKTSSLSFPIFL